MLYKRHPAEKTRVQTDAPPSGQSCYCINLLSPTNVGERRLIRKDCSDNTGKPLNTGVPSVLRDCYSAARCDREKIGIPGNLQWVHITERLLAAGKSVIRRGCIQLNDYSLPEVCGEAVGAYK